MLINKIFSGQVEVLESTVDLMVNEIAMFVLCQRCNLKYLIEVEVLFSSESVKNDPLMLSWHSGAADSVECRSFRNPCLILTTGDVCVEFAHSQCRSMNFINSQFPPACQRKRLLVG